MTMKFVVEQKTLKAMAYFMATKDIRYYLQGMKIEFTPHFTRAVATNGHVLGMRQEKRKGDNEGTGDLIIPNDVVAAICKISSLYKGAEMGVSITATDVSGEWSYQTYGDAPITFKAVDGQFPNYQQILSRVPDLNESETAATYNPNYLKAIYDAARTINGLAKDKTPNFQVRQNSLYAAVFTDGDLFALIMPEKQASIEAYPEWAMRSVKEQEASIALREWEWANEKARREQQVAIAA